MIEWLESVAGPEYVPAILWVLAALAAFVVILIIIRVVRRMSAGTFVAGGRSRKTRLAVMDATAVDSHRRLILVRRDDVEHLLLIGGPTDIVVEQNIRLLAPQQRRPGDPSAQPQPRPRPADAQPAPAPVPPAPPRPSTLPAPPPARPTPPPPTQRLREPVSEIRPAPTPAPRPLPPVIAPARPPAPSQDEIDDTLMHELEATLDHASAQAAPAKTTEQSLEEEMAKLLGELSTPKK